MSTPHLSDANLPEGPSNRARDILSLSPLIPVISILDPSHALPLAQALIEGGIRTLEVTLRTPHGLDAIRRMREAFPQACIGAGTVLDPEQFRQAEEAGAQFIISPGLTRELLEHGVRAGVPLIPGVATVSEVMMGYRLGYRVFKFFPAEVAGGTAALKAFAGPVPDVRFCPTGGIRAETAGQYLALPNVLAVGGTWLTPASAVTTGDWEQLRRLARESLAILKNAAGNSP